MEKIFVTLIVFSFGIFFATTGNSGGLDKCRDEGCDHKLYYDLAQDVHIDADVIIYPKILNLKSNRKKIISGIKLRENYDPHDIDGNSLELSIQFCSGCKVIYPDCGFPSHGRYISIFPRLDLIDDIGTLDLNFPTKLELRITGELKDGTPFEGLDIIWVIK